MNVFKCHRNLHKNTNKFNILIVDINQYPKTHANIQNIKINIPKMIRNGLLHRVALFC